MGEPLTAASLGSGDTSAGGWRDTPRIVRRLLVAFLAVYIVAFFALAALKTYYCTHTSDDTAIFNNLFWSTLHGRLFYNFVVDRNHLADHASFFLFLILPIYALVPGIATLLLLQTLSIGSAGIPFFLIARRRVRPWPALILTAAFLLHPGVVSQNVNQIHDTQFALPSLLWAFWFLERKDFPKFLLFFLLASIVKETVLATLLLFGVYAAIRGLRGKWAWFPPIYSVAFGATYLLVVSMTTGGWRGTSYFDGYGHTPQEIVRTLLFHPGQVLTEVYKPFKWVYLHDLLQPCGWVMPFFSPICILALPELLANLIATTPVLAVIWCHFSVIAAAFFCVAGAEGLGRVARKLSPRWPPQRTQSVLALAVLALTLSTAGAWFYPFQYRPTARQDVIREIIDLVPAQASVLAPRHLVAAFSERSRLATLDIKNPTFERLWGFDYAIFDRADGRNFLLSPHREMISAYEKSPAYRLLYQRAGFVVYKRTNP